MADVTVYLEKECQTAIGIFKDAGLTLSKIAAGATADIATAVMARGLSKSDGKLKCQTGYVRKTALQSMDVQTVSIPQNFAGLEAVDVPTRLMEQLFEIVDVDEQENEVIIRARHTWYQNLTNFTLWQPEEEQTYNCAAVCKNVLDNAIFPVKFAVATDCEDTLPGKDLDFERKNIVECFLDPENGICKKFGLSMIRDNDRFYVLKNVGYDRGFVVEAGKNMLGVERQESIDNLATRVAPIGKDSKGKIVWLDNNGLKYIDSPHINDYREPHVEIYDTGLVIGKDGVTAQNIQAKLLAAGQKRFTDDKVDLPEVTMRVEFISLGDTEEYKQYKDLDKVYLYDILTAKDTEKGYNYAAQVIGVEHDILTGMLNNVTIGMLQQADFSRKIAVWQVPEVDGSNIRLLSIQSGAFAPSAIQGDDIADHVIRYAHFASAAIDSLTAASITAVQAQIETIIAGHVTAQSIKTTDISAINATLGTATVTNGYIDNADITYLQVKAATAESLIARDAVTDKYFIDKLQVRNLQAVEATVGELVVKAADNKYYRLDIAANGSLSPTQVTPSAAEIAAGVTSNGHGAIIETDLTVADLSASNIKGINALIDKLTASRIDVDELFARQAFIGKLNTTDITSNSYLQVMVNAKNKVYRQWAEPTDAHAGDVWYQQGPQTHAEMASYTHAQLAQFPNWAFNGYRLFRREGSTWRQIDDPAEVRSTIAQILLETDNINLQVVQIDNELDNKYTVRSGIGIELAGIEISGSKYVRIKSGGKFVVDSGNFDIDESGNVSMTGKLITSEGQIGGFYIGATRLSAGTGSNFIAIDSGTANFDYFIMAGGNTDQTAKFLLTKGGNLTVESLTIRNEAGTATQQIDLSNYALWKLNYQAIKSYSANSITLTNGATINFNTAAGVVLSGGWEDDGGRRYTAIAKDGNNQEVGRISSGVVELWLGHSIANPANVKSALENANDHKTSIDAGADGVALTDSLSIDASGVYSQGYGAGETAGANGVYITDIGQQTAPSYANGYYTVHARADASNGRYRLDDLTVDASAAYKAGWNAYRAQLVSTMGGKTNLCKTWTYRGNLYGAPQQGSAYYRDCYNGLTFADIPAAM